MTGQETDWFSTETSSFWFPLSLPIHSAVPKKYAKPENVQTEQNAWRVYSWVTEFKCDVSADTVFMSGLRPQTAKPSRFLKDHQAWANHSHSLISNYLLIFWGGISLRKPYMAHLFKKQTKKKKKKRRKRKKIDVKNELRVSDDSHSPPAFWCYRGP